MEYLADLCDVDPLTGDNGLICGDIETTGDRGFLVGRTCPLSAGQEQKWNTGTNTCVPQTTCTDYVVDIDNGVCNRLDSGTWNVLPQWIPKGSPDQIIYDQSSADMSQILHICCNPEPCSDHGTNIGFRSYTNGTCDCSKKSDGTTEVIGYHQEGVNRRQHHIRDDFLFRSKKKMPIETKVWR